MRKKSREVKRTTLGYLYDLSLFGSACWLVILDFEWLPFCVFFALAAAGPLMFNSKLCARQEAVPYRWAVVVIIGFLVPLVLFRAHLDIGERHSVLEILSLTVLLATRLLLVPARSEAPA